MNPYIKIMAEDSYEIISKAISSIKRIQFEAEGRTVIAEPHFAYLGEVKYCAVKILGDNTTRRNFAIKEINNIVILEEGFSPDMWFWEESRKYHLKGSLLCLVAYP